MNDSDLERLVANLAWRAPTPALDDRIRDTLRTATIRAYRVRATVRYAAASLLLAAALLLAAFFAASVRPSTKHGADSLADVPPVAPPAHDDVGNARAPEQTHGGSVVAPFEWNRLAGIGTAPKIRLVDMASLDLPSSLAASAATLERFEPLLPPACSLAVASINAIYGPASGRGQAPAE